MNNLDGVEWAFPNTAENSRFHTLSGGDFLIHEGSAQIRAILKTERDQLAPIGAGVEHAYQLQA